MIKRFLLSFIILVVIILAGVFVYRYQIIQYSAETFIRKALPDYISIEKMNFDFRNNKVTFVNFRITNAPGFSPEYAVEIGEIICKYELKGKFLLDGIEILAPVLEKPVINIERQRDGRVNLAEMGKVIEAGATKRVPEPEPRKMLSAPKTGASKSISDVFKLPDTFEIKHGRIIFTDMLPLPKPYILTFDNINARLFLKLDRTYSHVLEAGSIGQGSLNDHPDEVIKWNISMNPNTPKLTMSNRFEVSNIDMLALAPYYDRYSPFNFQSGYMSGTLIFDFDNGNIGSTNEIHLARVAFSVKKGYENAEFWQTTVQDLAKYFTSFGEIVFDFKIKGDVNEPKFYLGPISKQALTVMAIDKVSAIIQEAANGPQGPKPETDKTQAYIDLIKGFLEKK